MRKRSSTVEWIVAENDDIWERVCASSIGDNPACVAQSATARQITRRILAGVALILLLLAGIGPWTRHATRAGPQRQALGSPVVEQRAGRLVTISASALGETDWRGQLGREYDGLLTAMQAGEPDEHLDMALHIIEFQGDLAVAEVLIYPPAGRPAYRQTRFYRRIPTGWQPVAPTAILWGPERSLETPSFVFHFRQRDAAAVVAVAPQIEAIYRIMQHNLGLPFTPTAEKLVIEVSVTQPPGDAAPWGGPPSHIIAPSPAVYLAPVEMTDGELLAQSLVLPLLGRVWADADKHHAIGSSWASLMQGLRLWQVWDMDLPLAVWRKGIVRWLYTDLSASPQRRLLVLPENYTALCGAHKLWMLSPIHLQIPLVCDDRDQRDWEFYWLGSPDPLVHLNQLAAPMPPDRDGYQQYTVQRGRPGKTVAAATLIEYAVTVYGQEHLPALVAELGQHESWETLIPAVYGVSAAEFEAGWQDYLAAHYGLKDFR